MSWTHFFDSHFSRISGNDVCFSTACKNHGVTMSWKDQHVRMSWKDLCFRMFSKVESFQMYLTHFFEGDFFSIAGDNVSFSIDWKTDGVTMSWKDQHVRMSWKDLCFRMFWKVESLQMYVTHFFPGYFSAFPGTAFVTGVLGKTMVSRCLGRKNLCGDLANTSVSERLRVCLRSA